MVKGKRFEDDDREGRALGGLVDLLSSLVAAELPGAVQREIERRDLVPRPAWASSQPSAQQVMQAALGAIEAATPRGPGTYVGGHKLVLDACRQMGVHGAELYPVLRRTRAQVEAEPNPARPREGMGRTAQARQDKEWPIKRTLPEQRAEAKRRRARGIPTVPVDDQAEAN